MRNVYLLFAVLVFIQCNALPMNTLNIHNPSISSLRPLQDIPNKLSIAKTTTEYKQQKKEYETFCKRDGECGHWKNKLNEWKERLISFFHKIWSKITRNSNSPKNANARPDNIPPIQMHQNPVQYEKNLPVATLSAYDEEFIRYYLEHYSDDDEPISKYSAADSHKSKIHFMKIMNEKSKSSAFGPLSSSKDEKSVYIPSQNSGDKELDKKNSKLPEKYGAIGLDQALLKPFGEDGEKFVHEYFLYFSPSEKFKDQYLKKFNDAKIKWISENSENDFSGKTVLINDENVTLESKLGEGSFGVAYRAHLSPMEKFAVVKFPKTTGGIDIDFLRRCTDQEEFVLRETDSLITYDKKNMVTIQKEIIGKSLYVHLKTLPESDPSFKELKSKYDKLAGEFIRKYEIVHGDVAPRNVILDPQGELHLIDFGSSIFVRPGHEEELITLASANSDAEWQRTVFYNQIPAALASPDTPHSKQVIRGYQKALRDLELFDDLIYFNEELLDKALYDYGLKKKVL